MGLTKKEIDQFMAQKRGPRARNPGRREQAVRLQLSGLTYQQIAAELGVSVQTVNKDLIAMRKLLESKS